MKGQFYKILMIAMVCLSSLSCNKAKENIDILINANVIRYTVLVEIKEFSGQIPGKLIISVTGEDAGVVYDITGKKDLQLNNGMITLGITPNNEPGTGNPVNFNIKITGSGYAGITVPVTVEMNKFNQVKTISIVKLSAPPAAVTIGNKTAPLGSDGTLALPLTVSSPVNSVFKEITTVTIPVNTQFLDGAGTQIIGTSVGLNVTNYDTRAAESVHLFPHGTFSASNVTDASNQSISAFFVPAGFAAVNLSVNNIEVKKFSQPIRISIQLDPSYKLLSAGQTIKEGDRLGIWSYNEATDRWKYEKEGIVTIINNKPVVEFTTDHLTIYSAAESVETTNCANPGLVFNASWLKTDTQPFILEIWNKDESKLLSSQTIIVYDGLDYQMNDLPPFEVKYKLLSNNREALATGLLSNNCSGGKLNVTISPPVAPVVGVSLSLIVKCPDKGIVIPPDFYVYYKDPASPVTAYELLGVVKRGLLSTTLLKLGQHYDFKAQWGSREKIIKNYLIDKDNLSTTVGLNDHIGNISPDKNRSILIEECNKI
jgi:hypothetical protein